MLVAKTSQLRLSVLDQSPSLEGRAEDASIRESLALAQHCEALGYERYWVSEHHALPGIAGSAPEVLFAPWSGTTMYGTASDTWSVGVVCFELMDGKVHLPVGPMP